MIQNLALTIAAHLQDTLEGVKIQTEPYLSVPTGADLPAVAIYPGQFTLQPSGREAPATPKEENIRQLLVLQKGQAKSGPYLLDFKPMANSVKAMVTVKDSPPVLLEEGSGFTVDYAAASVSFPGKKTKADDPVVVEYLSLQTVRQHELQQELFLDAYAASPADAEKWASLACAVSLSGAEALLNEVNVGGGVQRQGNFSAIHLSKQIQLVEGLPLFSESAPGYRLKFAVLGTLRLVQVFDESPARIQEVIITQNFG